MGKPQAFASADARPRAWFRIRAGVIQFAGNPSGPWTTTDDIAAALDEIGGDGAYARRWVLIWEGEA